MPKDPTKILVFDDSETVLEATALVLEEAGYEVITLQSPALFFATLQREKPALVLMDVEMPVLMGGSLVEMARKNNLHPSVMLLHSDKPADALAVLAKQCGANGFIQKTNDVPRFLRTISQHLAPTRTQA